MWVLGVGLPDGSYTRGHGPGCRPGYLLDGGLSNGVSEGPDGTDTYGSDCRSDRHRNGETSFLVCRRVNRCRNTGVRIGLSVDRRRWLRCLSGHLPVSQKTRVYVGRTVTRVSEMGSFWGDDSSF